MDNLFSFIITYTDDTGLWENIWKALKLQLNLHFASIKFKENMITMKSLNSLNIKMIPTSLEIPHIQMLILKINDFSDLKRGLKEKVLLFNEKNKNSFIIFLMDLENNDSSVKNSLKLMEKIKLDLKNNDLKLLPTNINHVKVADIVSEFFKELKTKISSEINSKITSFYNQIEILKNRKYENKEFTYNYIINKENLINYLQITDFWDEIYKINEEDIFIDFPQLAISTSYDEPFSPSEFNENYIKRKIFERNLSNLDHQQYIFFQILRSCKNLRDFKKLNNTLTKIFTEFSNLGKYFSSKFHFNLWSYIYCLKLIPFLKSLKTNFYHSLDEETNLSSQVYVYYQAKKFLKNYAISIRQDIPNIKLFYPTLNELIINPSKNNDEVEIIEATFSDKEFLMFINETNAGPFDQRYKKIINNKTELFQDYLNVLNTLEELNNLKHHPKLAVKMQLEKIPILLKLNQLNTIKTILHNCIKVLKKDKWEYIYNFYALISIILLSNLDKTEENINLILDFMNFQSRNIENISSVMNFNSENFEFDFISNYLNSNDFKQNNVNIRNVNLDITKILDLSITEEKESNENLELIPSSCCHNYTRRIKMYISDSKTLIIRFNNKSKLTLLVDCVKLFFVDEISNEKIMFETGIEKFLLERGDTLKSFLFEAGKYDRDMNLRLNNILIRLTCGVEGLYNMDNQNFVINIKSSNLSLNYVFVNKDSDNCFFTNTLYNSYFIFSNMPNNSNFKLELRDNNNEDNLKILQGCELYEMDDDKEIIEKLKRIEFKFIKCISNEENDLNLENNSITIRHIRKEKIILKVPLIFSDKGQFINKFKLFSINLYSLDKNSNILFREEVKLRLFSIFEINNRLRIKDKSILVQSSIKLNLNLENLEILVTDDEKYQAEIDKKVNFVKSFGNMNIEQIYKKPFFTYTIKKNHYLFYISQTEFQPYICNMHNFNYFIRVWTYSNHNYLDGVQIFNEMKLAIEIEKFSEKDSILMIKVKENINWNIIGKSKIYERFTNKCKRTFTFNLIPFTDGYIRLPEINIQEHNLENIEKIDNEENNSNSTLEFLILSNSIIEGNQKIIKVYPINNFQMKLNII